MAAGLTLGAEEVLHLVDLDRWEPSARALPVPAIRQLDGPYRERVREALSDPAAKRRGLFRPETVERMLREPNATRTTLGSNALWQLALLEMWLQKVEDLAR